MQYFLGASFIGTLVLLAAHVMDYALDAMRRPGAAARVAMPDHEGPIDEAGEPMDWVQEYEHAA